MSDDAKREGLLPCPFCGGEAAYLRNEECDDKGEPSENYGGEWVECSKCHACTNIRFPLKEPVKPLLAEQWNRRAAPVSAQTPAGEARCTCEACTPNEFPNIRMVLCARCGNKRCPHATNHRNVCTNSNEAGQPGSSYGPPAQPSKVVAALQAELKWFRRKLCAVYAGPLAYMEDGEAQDARAHPIIDFLRDSPESIEAAMMKRAVAELGEGRE